MFKGRVKKTTKIRFLSGGGSQLDPTKQNPHKPPKELLNASKHVLYIYIVIPIMPYQALQQALVVLGGGESTKVCT